MRKSLVGIILLAAGLAGPRAATAQEAAKPVVTTDAQAIDVILLLDESGSMKSSDPNDLRRVAVYQIAEEMKLAGPTGSGATNQVGVLVFGTTPKPALAMTQDADKALSLKNEDLSLPDIMPGANSYRTLESTPPRALTDIYSGLKSGMEILRATATGEKKQRTRYLVLLTDGKMQPWPGDLRFGDYSRQYRSSVLDAVPQGGRLPATEQFSDQFCSPQDRQRIQDEIIPVFRENGWVIHAIGFSDRTDSEFLRWLSEQTGGKAAIANDVSQMVSLLDDLLPHFRNVIRFRDIEFCDQEVFLDTVTLPALQASIFRVDFASRASAGLPQPSQVRVELVNPDGKVYSSSNPGEFTLYQNSKGRVLFMAARVEHPPSGAWRVKITGIGYRPCGKFRISGRRDQRVVISVSPASDVYMPGAQVDVEASLVGESGPIAISGAKGELISRGRGFVAPLTLPTVQANKATGKLQFPVAEDDYTIRVELLDSTTGGRVEGQVTVPVKREQVDVKWTPSSINLGKVSPGETTPEGTAKLTINPPRAADIRVTKPVLELGGVPLLSNWITVNPEDGKYDPSTTYNIGVRVSLPTTPPSNLKSGEYTGKMTVASGAFQNNYQKIPVKVQVVLPDLILSPSEVTLRFRKSFTIPQTAGITVKTNSPRSLRLTVRIPEVLYSTANPTEERVRLEVQNAGGVWVTSAEQEMTVSSGSPGRLNLRVVLKDEFLEANHKLDPDTRIQPDQYSGEIQVWGDGTPERPLRIDAHVPVTSWNLWIIDHFPLIPLVALGIAVLSVVALGIFGRVFRSRRDSLPHRGDYEVPGGGRVYLDSPAIGHVRFPRGINPVLVEGSRTDEKEVVRASRDSRVKVVIERKVRVELFRDSANWGLVFQPLPGRAVILVRLIPRLAFLLGVLVTFLYPILYLVVRSKP